MKVSFGFNTAKPKTRPNGLGRPASCILVLDLVIRAEKGCRGELRVAEWGYVGWKG